jgi:hypothetical protein
MANKPLPKKLPAPPPNKRNYDGTRGREVAGILALGASLFVLFAMLSSQAHALVMGPFGRNVAAMVYRIAGLGSYALVTMAVVASVRWRSARRSRGRRRGRRWAAGAGGVAAAAVPGYCIAGIGLAALGGNLPRCRGR